MGVNFDNAATSFPKPPEVRKAALYAIDKCGGNPGRGGHALAMLASEAVFAARENAADFFGADAENVVFTSNCTHALNLAVQGILHDGGHIVISDLEHNSMSRPVAALQAAGRATYSVAHVDPDPEKTVRAFAAAITPQTKAIGFTLASNVTGQVLPWRALGALCKERGICCIADGAQACGILPVTLADGINILCTAGHKGLYGAPGTGLLVSDGRFHIAPLMQGGTGSTSLELTQPEFLPDSLESGTINTLGALTLDAGLHFVRRMTTERILAHETQLCERFLSELRGIPGVTVYRNPAAQYAPIVSFCLDGTPPQALAQILSEHGFFLRAGYHCAALAHKSLGTTEGTVRFAPSVFNRETEVVALAGVIRRVATQRKN